jgi:hypothetical protein
MTFEASVCGSNDLGRLNQDSRLEPMLSPAAAPRESFIPSIVLPGSNERILQQRIKRFF